MKRVYYGLVGLLMASPAFGQADVPGSKDYPGISRMPNYYVANYEESSFDSFKFRVTERGQQKEQAVEGRRVSIRYNLTENAPMPSQLQVLRNYQSAARAAGGQVVFDDGENTTLHLSKGGSETWIYVQTGNRPSGLPIFFDIIEKKAMQQDVTIDAKAMATGLAETGRVALYGIFFDTGKAELKPESAPALAEIAKLLKDDAALKVYVVGHTDMVADLAGNVKLSQARAQAVVSALEKQNGIAGARLIAFGAGPYAPVATNKTEEGRAKNRRVELVEIATR
ncbi:MAG: OmpA family protein [Acidobacteria bacterium]|nr:OmpA family protein [Acidobacteriota bacterium]